MLPDANAAIVSLLSAAGSDAGTPGGIAAGALETAADGCATGTAVSFGTATANAASLGTDFDGESAAVPPSIALTTSSGGVAMGVSRRPSKASDTSAGRTAPG
jgi:hypothetical protein